MQLYVRLSPDSLWLEWSIASALKCRPDIGRGERIERHFSLASEKDKSKTAFEAGGVGS